MKCLCCDHVDSAHRYACSPCVDQMRRWLREIETYAAMLPHMLEPLRGDSVRGAPGYASTPPARLGPLVALDPRSKPLALGRDEDVFDAETDDEDPTSSILSKLNSLARWLREEQELPEPTGSPTITKEIGYLLGAVDWCAQQQWVDELYGEIKELHQQDRALAKDIPPGPLADCMNVTCSGKVFWTRDIRDPDNPQETLDAARCNNESCGRLYYGTDLVRLRAGRREAS